MNLFLTLYALLGLLLCLHGAAAQEDDPPVAEEDGAAVEGDGAAAEGGVMKYWLHSSCKKYPLKEGKELNIRPYIKEMFQMASLAAKRMKKPDSKDPRDVEFRRMWQIIFKTTLDDPILLTYSEEYLDFFGLTDSEGRETAFNIVHDTLHSLATDWTETKKRTEADNRIYCDNGAHFKDFDEDTGREIDKKNNVWTEYNCDTGGLRGFVTCDAYDESVEDEDQPCTITLCDLAFLFRFYPGTKSDLKPSTLTKLAERNKLASGVDIDKHASLSTLLLHEWSHSQPHLTEDWATGGEIGEGGTTSDWVCIRGIPDAQHAVINAEALSTIGLAALLLEGNANGEALTLDREYEDLFEAAKNSPKMISYPDLKKEA